MKQKNNKIKTIFYILLSCILVLSFVSCGKTKNKTDKKEVTGVQQKWGTISVYVPDNMFMTGGTLNDKTDKNALWLKDKTDPELYITIMSTDAKSALEEIEFTKKIETGTEIKPFETKNISWSGITYDYGYNPCFTILGDAANTTYIVNGTGFDINDETVQMILSSIR